jgi:hypothetical protein
MRLRVKHYFAGLALLALTLPVWARTYKQSLAVNKNTTIGSAQLQPGSYDLTADDSKPEITIMQKGKVVATVPGEWVKIQQKAKSSNVESDGDKVTEVQFSGMDQAFKVQ